MESNTTLPPSSPTEPTPVTPPAETPDAALRIEFERLLVLARMPEQERVNACDQEIGSVLKKWRCALVVQAQLINGIPKYNVAIQLLRGL